MSTSFKSEYTAQMFKRCANAIVVAREYARCNKISYYVYYSPFKGFYVASDLTYDSEYICTVYPDGDIVTEVKTDE